MSNWQHKALARRTTISPALVAVILAWLFATLVSQSGGWQRLELRVHDLLAVQTAPNRSQLPITIIGIDETSFQQIGRQWPWPRRLHAQLIDQAHKAGALVIALDLMMSEASADPEDDRLLAEAIARAGNVVVAAGMQYQESQYARQWLRVDPLDVFRNAGAGVGLTNIIQDSDLVVRRMPEGKDVFWRSIIDRANQRAPGMLTSPPDQTGRMIGYAGPDRTFPYVSYYQALRAETDLPPSVFQDQIVIIGLDAKASANAQAVQPDQFATPFTSVSEWLTAGAELHANFLESALTGRGVQPLGRLWGWILAITAILAAGILMREWRPLLSGLAGLALIGLTGALATVLFVHQLVWIPCLGAMFGVALVYAQLGTHAYFTERRQRRETRRAFSMYLAPEVVDEIMAHPEKLKLGGERREVTLLFTDLAGFTTLSEMLGPEQVAQLLNEHFSRATAIIKQRGGTVNRFIGDAIMAFWGAPLADPDQALHACESAIEMQLDMRALRDELAARGLPPLHMRVGIHSGPAILGNLGSVDRFDYTAIGDSVNLAARLEGVNKLYGTEILLSIETAKALRGRIGLRRVDRVIVKGKTEAVDIFTVCEDAELVRLTDVAWEAYRQGDWSTSLQGWDDVLAHRPGDSVARLYQTRVSELSASVADPAWQGALALEKL
ncbi:MAG: adenylate/guanylate cyclase domain-containing protein [Burkholderiales bacterium]|nr:adenylate/guanylate cyclase domain-containing protein [Burkholderiales bacterium]